LEAADYYVEPAIAVVAPAIDLVSTFIPHYRKNRPLVLASGVSPRGTFGDRRPESIVLGFIQVQAR
jgi:hypothetical protein